MSQQCTHAEMKINHVWDCMTKNVAGRLRDKVTQLCPVCVRPNLKFCVQSGALKHKKYIGRLEKAPRRTACVIKGLEYQRSETRLREQSLFSLKKHLRGEIISILNYLMSSYGENRFRLFLKMNNIRRRGNGEKFQ